MKGFVKESAVVGVPVFQKVNETAQGGFRLDVSLLIAGAIIAAGTPIAYDESTCIAKVVKSGVAYAAALNTDTTYQVKKGHNFLVGDYLALTVGSKAYAITAIDTSNADYDVLTTGTTLGAAVAIGDVFFQSSATGASAAAYSPAPRGLLYQDTTVETGADVAVVIDGTVYERRIPNGIHSAVKTALPKIFFSQSF